MRKILLLAVVALLILSPKYLFNVFESNSNKIFNSIEEARDKNDYKKVKALLLTHKSILNNQKKLTFLLPKKYAEYFSRKDNLYNKYYSALDKFVTLEEHNQGINEVLNKKREFDKSLTNPKEQKINAMDIYIVLNSYVTQKETLKEYLDNKYITQELYDGFLKDIEKDIEIYNLLNDTAEGKLTVDVMVDKLSEINFNYKSNDLDRLLEDSNNVVSLAKQKEWVDIYTEADQELYLVADFYKKKELGKIFMDNKYETTIADLNGDGKGEIMVLTNTLIAYDENNNELGRLPAYFPIKRPIAGSAKVFTPNNDEKKQFVIYDFDLGENNIKSLLFGLMELKRGGFEILPVCKSEKPESISDCYFSKDEVKI